MTKVKNPFFKQSAEYSEFDNLREVRFLEKKKRARARLSLGKLFASYRKRCRFTQADLAYHMEVSPSYIQQAEGNVYKTPDAYIKKLIVACDLSVTDVNEITNKMAQQMFLEFMNMESL